MRGFVYCIKSEKTNEMYVGSTTQKINNRFSSHKKLFSFKAKVSNV